MNILTQHPIVILNGKRLIAKREYDYEELLIGYPLIDPENKDGISYAHVKNGKVMRFHEIIADVGDIIETEEVGHVDDRDLSSGISRMMDLF